MRRHLQKNGPHDVQRARKLPRVTEVVIYIATQVLLLTCCPYGRVV